MILVIIYLEILLEIGGQSPQKHHISTLVTSFSIQIGKLLRVFLPQDTSNNQVDIFFKSLGEGI